MINGIKKIGRVLICFALIIAIGCLQISAHYKPMSWYVQRNKDHRQPVLPREFEFLKDLNTIYVGDSNNKKVYLTFDAGYENGNVEKILNVLARNEVQGAFFILSNLIKSSPELVKRMAEENHLVCNHTSTHKDMSGINSEEEFCKELVELENQYKNLTGREMSKYFRPPEGKFDHNTLEFARELGYKTVFWSFAYADWDNDKQPSAEYAKNKILENMHNGAILLLHPTSSTNASVLEDVIIELKRMGYQFGSLDDIK